jgi:hypothetical protein
MHPKADRQDSFWLVICLWCQSRCPGVAQGEKLNNRTLLYPNPLGFSKPKEVSSQHGASYLLISLTLAGLGRLADVCNASRHVCFMKQPPQAHFQL